MNEPERLCGLYMRVSTEDQAKEGFSLPEQKERLEALCKFKNWKIIDYYEDAGISAKTGNHRPEFDRMIEDAKKGKINTVIALKLDRLTRSIYDWENMLNMSEKYKFDLVCANDEINTTNANGKMITRIMMSVSQNEIERTSERTKVGMAGAIKQGHIPGLCPIGYRRTQNKTIEPDPLTKDIVIRIFNLYFEGKSYSTIANIFNEEKVLNKTNWRDVRILKILSNPIYKGDYVAGKTVGRPISYENVVEPIVSKELWENCQAQKKKNQKNYMRTQHYIFLQKLRCPKCGRILAGGASHKIKADKWYFYYRCEDCKNNIKEEVIEKSVKKMLADILEYDNVVNEFFLPVLKAKIDNPKEQLEKELKSLHNKKDRIRKAYIDSLFTEDEYKEELSLIESQIELINAKLLENKQCEQLNFTPEDILLKRDMNYINHLKLPISYYAFNKCWELLEREQKSNIIMRYIDDIELETKGNKFEVKQVNFRSTFYNDFETLYKQGVIDKTRPIFFKYDGLVTGGSIRYSEYLPIKDVLENLYRLNIFYEVNFYKGTYYKKTEELKIGPFLKDEAAVRLFPLQPNDNENEDWVSVGMLTTRPSPNDIKVNIIDVFEKLPPKVSKDLP